MTSQQTFAEYGALLRDFIRVHSTAGVAGLPRHSAATAGATEGVFDTLARGLFDLQFSHNPGYRRFCEARAVTPQSVRHWSEIPAMPASAFKELELTSLAPEERLRVFHSSGTTEQRPARHFHDGESLRLYEASLLPWFKCHLVDLDTHPHSTMNGTLTPPQPSPLPRRERRGGAAGVVDGSSVMEAIVAGAEEPGLSPAAVETEQLRRSRFVSLTPPPEVAPHSSLVHMFAAVRREFGSRKSRFTGRVGPDGAWIVDVGECQAALRDAIANQEPVTVMGTAFNFVELLDQLEDAGVQLKVPGGSRVLETGGYKGRTRALPKSELHAGIAEALGIPEARIVSEYGMCELSSQAYDLNVQSPSAFAGPTADQKSKVQELPRVFHFPPWARVQVVSPENGAEVGEGETGLIRVFDLANARSVLAVQTEDLGIRRGDGFELLGRAELAEARGCSLMSATNR